jgi:hypothetical protein
MAIRRLPLILALFLVPLGVRADEENPFKKAKKGDWVEYKMTTSAMGFNIEGTLKQTITEKDDKSVTMKITGKAMGNDFPPQTQKIDLTKPFVPGAGLVPGGANAKVEKLDSGKETLEVGGKKHECEWVKTKVNDAEVKVWLSKSAPLGGMVKMEMKSKVANVTLEMTEFGTDK